MKPLSLLAILFALTFSACTKKNVVTKKPITGDYFIYGYTGAFVDVNTRTTYSIISNGELKKDTSQLHYKVPVDVNNFNFNVIMPTDEYKKVADLPYAIPAELYAMNDASIGVMLADAGYTDVRVRQNGVEYKWRFEANQDASSAAVRSFVNRLR